MPKVVSGEIKLEAAKRYLMPGQTAESTAKHFGIGKTALFKYLHETEDEQLKHKVEMKLGMYGQSNRIKCDIWATLSDKEITKNKLIDWYIKVDGPQEITVKQLVEQARLRGIKVKM